MACAATASASASRAARSARRRSSSAVSAAGRRLRQRVFGRLQRILRLGQARLERGDPLGELRRPRLGGLGARDRVGRCRASVAAAARPCPSRCGRWQRRAAPRAHRVSRIPRCRPSCRCRPGPALSEAPVQRRRRLRLVQGRFRSSATRFRLGVAAPRRPCSQAIPIRPVLQVFPPARAARPLRLLAEPFAVRPCLALRRSPAITRGPAPRRFDPPFRCRRFDQGPTKGTLRMDIAALAAAHPDHWRRAAAIRTLTLDAVAAANSGHSGMPMGMADVATVLFEKHLRFDASAPDWPDRDRFILSAGHGSMLLYGAAVPHRLAGHDAGADEELPPAGLDHRGPPRIRPCQGDRDDDRPAGPGARQRGGLRHGRGIPARRGAGRSSITAPG
jgi:hypothetical protein